MLKFVVTFRIWVFVKIEVFSGIVLDQLKVNFWSSRAYYYWSWETKDLKSHVKSLLFYFDSFLVLGSLLLGRSRRA